jgi:hypothetical protein
MVSIDKTLIRIERAASLLGVCPDTLRDWEREGKIQPFRTHGGHRRYRLSEIESLRGEALQHIQEQQPTVVICDHSERRHYAKGLCKSCYYKSKPNNKALRRLGMIKKYGMTQEWYDQQVVNGCEICGTSDWGEKGPCIDHNHNCCTGCSRCVRGVLCGRCNKMLGNALDDTERLRKGIEYLNTRQLPEAA